MKAAHYQGRLRQAADKSTPSPFKNVEVLKGLSEPEMYSVMNLISAGIGADCIGCHVKTGDQWEYDKDAKRPMQTARKMIQITIDINKANFNGQTQVTCYTCHLGHERPSRVPPLPRVAEANPGPRPGQPRPSPQELLAKYVQAVVKWGGRGVLR